MVWYEDEVKRVIQEKGSLPYNPEVIFYGSSSIRLWENLYSDFEELKPANLGFGGSTLAACDWFFSRILAGLHPKHIVFYAGDNDLGDGRNPEEVYLFFQQLLALLKEHFPAVPFTFISIKPSIARWNIIQQITYTNQLVQEAMENEPNCFYVNIFDAMLAENGKPDARFFDADGLHLSKEGYALWKDLLTTHLNKNL